jgi:hypothetical protein
MTSQEQRNRTQPSKTDQKFLDIGVCDKSDEVKAALPKWIALLRDPARTTSRRIDPSPTSYNESVLIVLR